MKTSRGPWAGPVEASLMYFDPRSTLLKTAAAVADTKGQATDLDYSAVILAYGDGIAGSAFKSNQVRAYVDDGEKSVEASESGTTHIPFPSHPIPSRSSHHKPLSVRGDPNVRGACSATLKPNDAHEDEDCRFQSWESLLNGRKTTPCIHPSIH